MKRFNYHCLFFRFFSVVKYVRQLLSVFLCVCTRSPWPALFSVSEDTGMCCSPLLALGNSVVITKQDDFIYDTLHILYLKCEEMASS